MARRYHLRSTQVTAITMELLGEPLLQKHLSGPTQQALVVKGQITCETSQTELFVVDRLKTNLLGLPAIKALKMSSPGVARKRLVPKVRLGTLIRNHHGNRCETTRNLHPKTHPPTITTKGQAGDRTNGKAGHRRRTVSASISSHSTNQ